MRPPAIHACELTPQCVNRGPGTELQQTFAIWSQQAGNIRERRSLVLDPMKTVERVNTVERSVSLQEPRHIVRYVQCLVSDVGMVEMASGVVDHGCRSIRTNQSSTGQASRHQDFAREVTDGATDVQKLLAFAWWSSEGRVE